MFRNRKALLCLGLAMASGLTINPSAQALPLLAENAGIYVNDLITAYPDSQDPNLVYFMPNSSMMAKDETGLPQFGMTYWGISTGKQPEETGGFLSFTMRLKADDSLNRGLDDLRKQGKRIAVLPVQASTIGLTSTKAGTPLGAIFSEFNFAKMGGRAEDEVGVNAVLTAVGARAFISMIDTPQAFKFDYCYKVQGLGPNFDAHITVDMKRIYDHFEANASGGGWWTSVAIHTEIEKLRQEGAVNIVINGGDAKVEEYVRAVAADMVKRMFTPELGATHGSASGGGGWSFSRFSLSTTHKEEFKKEEWNYTRRDLVDREFCAALSLKDIKAHKADLVRDADKN